MELVNLRPEAECYLHISQNGTDLNLVEEFFDDQHPPSFQADGTGKALWTLRPKQATAIFTNRDAEKWNKLSFLVDGYSETLRAKIVVKARDTRYFVDCILIGTPSILNLFLR